MLFRWICGRRADAGTPRSGRWPVLGEPRANFVSPFLDGGRVALAMPRGAARGICLSGIGAREWLVGDRHAEELAQRLPALLYVVYEDALLREGALNLGIVSSKEIDHEIAIMAAIVEVPPDGLFEEFP